MKTTLLFIICFGGLIIGFGQANVPNHSFENWYDINVKDSLNEWVTSTLQYQSMGQLDVNNSYQIANAHTGSSAVHMETIFHFNQGSGQNDTIFGYAVWGQPNSGLDGLPYTDTVDVLNFWYKCGIVAGDQAVAIVQLSKNGTVYSSTVYPIIGNQSVWTEVNLPLLNGATEKPDSVFVGFASSNPFTSGTALENSWLEIDDVSFSFVAGSVVPSAIPNNSFENWTYITIQQPTSWFSFDQLLYPMTQSLYATKSSTASDGLSSLQIETTLETIMVGIPAVVTNGVFDPGLDSVIGGTPFIAQPAMISGVYQFTPALTDTAFVFIDFWNTLGHTQYVDTLLSASVWTPWSIDLTFTEAPDSVLIYLWGGNNLGSVLLIDNILFTGGDVSIDENSNKYSWSVYPNPATSNFVIQFEEADLIRVFDMSGKLVSTYSVTTDKSINISTEDFTNGIYLIQLINNGLISSQKISVNK